MKDKICSQDVELLAVGLRAYYVPREYSHTDAIVVYIPPRAVPAVACDVIHEAVARIQTRHPDAFILISQEILIMSASLPTLLALYSMLTVPLGKIRHLTCCMLMPRKHTLPQSSHL